LLTSSILQSVLGGSDNTKHDPSAMKWRKLHNEI